MNEKRFPGTIKVEPHRGKRGGQAFKGKGEERGRGDSPIVALDKEIL